MQTSQLSAGVLSCLLALESFPSLTYCTNEANYQLCFRVLCWRMLTRLWQLCLQLDMRVVISVFPEPSNTEVHMSHVSVLVCCVLVRVPADSGGCSRRCDAAKDKPAALRKDPTFGRLSAESHSTLFFMTRYRSYSS